MRAFIAQVKASNGLRPEDSVRFAYVRTLPSGVTSTMTSPEAESGRLTGIIITRQIDKQEVHAKYRALGSRFIAGLNLPVPQETTRRGRTVEKVIQRNSWETAVQKALPEAVKHEAAGWDAYEAANAAKESDESKAREKAREVGEEKERKVPWRQDVSDVPDLVGAPVVELGDAGRLAKAFNLRSVQPGENIPDDEYEHHLRHAEVALRDLAGTLGIRPEQASLSGRLGIAFAARGRGKFAAHYEPSRKAINITRFRGAGTLAHEWGHFLDNIMAEVHGGATTAGRGSFASEADGLWNGHHGTMAPELGSAFRDLHRAMRLADPATAAENRKKRDARLAELRKSADEVAKRINEHFMRSKGREGEAERAPMRDEHAALRKEFNALSKMPTTSSNYAAHAHVMSGGKAGYWSEGTEMFARAFEAYVQDKIEGAGKRNSYLVDGTRKGYARTSPMPDGSPAQPYPQGEERARINVAFDHLMEVLRSGGHLEKALRLRQAAGLA